MQEPMRPAFVISKTSRKCLMQYFVISIAKNEDMWKRPRLKVVPVVAIKLG